MRCVIVSAFISFLVLCTALGRPVRESLVSRGSSSSGGSPDHHSTGYLDDIVAQAMKRPLSSSSRTTHSTQSHLAQGHSVLPHSTQSHAMQGHPAFEQPKQVHPTHDHPMQPARTWHQDIRTPGLIHLAAIGTYKKPRKGGQSAKPELKKTQAELEHSSGSSKAPAQPERKGLPRGRPKKKPGDPVSSYTWKDPKKLAKAKAARTEPIPWWKQAEGMPRQVQGTSPDYEKYKGYRERKKLRDSAHNPPDEHPSGPHHQGPHGGPPSPGAGSHAVSR